LFTSFEAETKLLTRTTEKKTDGLKKLVNSQLVHKSSGEVFVDLFMYAKIKVF